MKLLQYPRLRPTPFLKRQRSTCSQESVASCESTIALWDAVDCLGRHAVKAKTSRRRKVSFNEHCNTVHESAGLILTVQDCKNMWYSPQEMATFRQVAICQVKRQSAASWSRAYKKIYMAVSRKSLTTDDVQDVLRQAVPIPDEAFGLEKHVVAPRQNKMKKVDLVYAILQIQDNSNAFAMGVDDKADTMRTASRHESRTALFMAHLVAQKLATTIQEESA